jgi:hypothetical protein
MRKKGISMLNSITNMIPNTSQLNALNDSKLLINNSTLSSNLNSNSNPNSNSSYHFFKFSLFKNLRKVQPVTLKSLFRSSSRLNNNESNDEDLNGSYASSSANINNIDNNNVNNNNNNNVNYTDELNTISNTNTNEIIVYREHNVNNVILNEGINNDVVINRSKILKNNKKRNDLYIFDHDMIFNMDDGF